jgi:hypothetical protein
MEAMWDCASQLWMPGRSRVHGRPYLNFCPVTLQHFSFRSWFVCRWMPVWKRSRLVPFLSGWGHRKGGLGGGSGGSSPKIGRAFLYNIFSCLLKWLLQKENGMFWAGIGAKFRSYHHTERSDTVFIFILTYTCTVLYGVSRITAWYRNYGKESRSTAYLNKPDSFPPWLLCSLSIACTPSTHLCSPMTSVLCAAGSCACSSPAASAWTRLRGAAPR